MISQLSCRSSSTHVAFIQDDIQVIQQRHGFRQGEFSAFDFVAAGRDGVIGCSSEIGITEVGIGKAAVRKVCEPAVGFAQIHLCKVNLTRSTFHYLKFR
jgi:hypothetical protein